MFSNNKSDRRPTRRRQVQVAVVAVLLASATIAHAERFTWTIDPTSSVNTKLTATYNGITTSDTKPSNVAGSFGGMLGLPAYDFASILIDQADVGFTSNPTFNLSFGFLGGATITSNGLGFALPGPNGKSTIPTTPFPVDLAGAFAQSDTGVEGRGMLAYAGYGFIANAIGTGSIALVDISPIPGDLAGTLTQVGNQIRITTPLALDQTTTLSNGVTVRAQVAGNVVANATTTAGGWKLDAGGLFATATSWSSGSVPTAGASIDTAVLGHVITAPRTIVSVNSSVRRLIVASSVPYTVSGVLTVGEAVDVREGTGHTLASVNGAAVAFPIAANAGVNVNALTLSGAATKTGDGSLTLGTADVGSLTITAGKVNVGTRLRVNNGSVVIPGTSGQLDLGTGRLEVKYASPSAVDATLSVVRAEIRDGYAGGAFNGGGGIVSNAITPGSNKAIGYGDRDALPGTSYGGQSAPSSVVALVTRAGDADLNFTVDFDDLLALAKHYNTASYWTGGDFNYDGTTDFADLLTLAKNYGQSSASPAVTAELPAGVAADWAIAQSLVPEPATLAALFAGGVTAFARRRR